MNAINDKDLRHAYVALLFGDSQVKYWSDEGLEELAKASADMMMSNWEIFYKILKKRKNFGNPDYDGQGVWYDNTGVDVSLRVDFDGNISVDG